MCSLHNPKRSQILPTFTSLRCWPMRRGERGRGVLVCLQVRKRVCMWLHVFGSASRTELRSSPRTRSIIRKQDDTLICCRISCDILMQLAGCLCWWCKCDCVHAACDCNSLACAIVYVIQQITFRALKTPRDLCANARNFATSSLSLPNVGRRRHTQKTHSQGYTSKCVRKWPIINTMIAESTHSTRSRL